MTMAGRWTGLALVVVLGVSVTAACSGDAKVDVTKLCRRGIVSAKLELTRGNVVPASMTRSLRGTKAANLYVKVCRALVTAPPSPNGPVHCPDDRFDPGTVRIEFRDTQRVFDSVRLVPTGCQTIRSTRLGSLGQTESPQFENAVKSIVHAFGLSRSAIYGR